MIINNEQQSQQAPPPLQGSSNMKNYLDDNYWSRTSTEMSAAAAAGVPMNHPVPPLPPLYPPFDDFNNYENGAFPQTATHFDSVPLLSRGMQGQPQQTEAVRQLLQFMNTENIASRGSEASAFMWPSSAAWQQQPAAAGDYYIGDPTIANSNDGCGVTVTVEGVYYNFQLTEDDIEKVFRRYGDLRSVSVLPPDNNTAQVNFFAPEAAQEAIQGLDGKVLNGVEGVLRVVWGLFPMIPRMEKKVEAAAAPAVVNTPPPGIPARVESESTNGGENDWVVPPAAAGSNPEPSDGQKYNRLLTEWDVENFFEAAACEAPHYNDDENNNEDDQVDEEEEKEKEEEQQQQPDDTGKGISTGEVSSLSGDVTKEKMEDDVSKLLSEGSDVSSSSMMIPAKVKNSAGKGLLGDGAALPEVTSPVGRNKGPRGSSSPSKIANGAGGGSVRKYTCRFDIGIENDKDFQVARRIIGQKGSNMKKIVNVSNAKLRLRGQGSGYLEGAGRTESPDPLHLCISCLTRDGYDKAVAETASLLKKIYSDWRDFNVKKHRGDPGFLEIQMKEHFLMSGQAGGGGGEDCHHHHHGVVGQYYPSRSAWSAGGGGRHRSGSSTSSPKKRAQNRIR
ncbi:hypothetical protein FOL47_007869 [Perkinsus chesapeaki]|uniref:RRM domain-containing protein n=1 Tax=Perkinsus chesapeaki TaxID=330153 RepID=A0A7J6LHE5_PERCH|nr:hypothetical protein FOL47_007869 [Perkinsus chesapeaki]